MRAGHWLICAVLLLCPTSAGGAPPPPPPPPPPPDVLAPEIDGYATAPIWSGYFDWLRLRMARAREEALALGGPPSSSQTYRAQIGPLVRVLPESPEHGLSYSFVRWCTARMENCTWVVRRAQVAPRTMMAFFTANFSAERAIANLRENGVTPQQASERRIRSYGLPDPLHDPLANIDVGDVTETTCPQILESLRVVEERASRMSADTRRPRSPPPAPWPHSAMYEITIPGWYVHERGAPNSMSGDLKLTGFAGAGVGQLVADMFAPLRACTDLR